MTIASADFRDAKNLATPAAYSGIGVLRLRSCFAKRSSYSAQDDNFLFAVLISLLLLVAFLSQLDQALDQFRIGQA